MALTPPIIQVQQLDITEHQDPAGRRNIPGSYFAFDRIVALGCQSENPINLSTTSGTMIFRDVNFDVTNVTSHITSRVEPIIIRIATSGVGISNMRLWLKNQSALTLPAQSVGLDPAFVQFRASGVWLPNAVLPSGAGTRLTTVMPTSANILRQDGGAALIDNNDNNVSQYVYMNLVVPQGFPLGNFGVCGSGLLRFNLTFDYQDVSDLLPPGSV